MHKIYLYVTSKCGDAVIRRLYVVQFHISLENVFPDNYEL